MILKLANNFLTDSASLSFNKSILLLTVVIPFISILGFLEATLYLIKSLILTIGVLGSAYVLFKVFDV